MFGFFRKAAQGVPGYPYLAFQNVFQLYNSHLYTPTDRTMPEDSVDNPLAVFKAVVMGISPDFSDVLEDPKAEIFDLYHLRNDNNDWIVYGGLKKDGVERFFMGMFGTTQVPAAEGVDTYFVPYFLFDAVLGNTQEAVYLLPQLVVTGLQTDPDEVIFAEYKFPGEFGQAMCFADASFCQILGNQPVDISQNQKWVDEHDDTTRRQKIAWIQGRDFKVLQTQIRNEAKGSTPVAGLGLKPL
jgi:hypothetical protein